MYFASVCTQLTTIGRSSQWDKIIGRMGLSTINNYIFACDESGGKGYSNVGEKYDGEVGVFAGLLLSEGKAVNVRRQLQAVHDEFSPHSGKYHIADLDPEQQALLRSAIFKVIQENNIPCLWHAIHVEGFHTWFTKQNATLKASRAEMDDGKPKRVKSNSPRDNDESLHVHLFTGLYGTLVGYFEDKEISPVSLEIRSDHIDKPVVKSIEKSAERLFSDEPEVITKTGFDTLTQEVVRGSITVSVTWPEEYRMHVDIQKSEIDTTGKDDPLVLAADVLANSLHHYFKQRGPSDKYRSLNSLPAIKDHPLSSCLYSLAVDDYTCMSDQIYHHPKAPDFP